MNTTTLTLGDEHIQRLEALVRHFEAGGQTLVGAELSARYAESIRALLSVSTADAMDRDEATREVIQPLKEPVTIGKALLAGRVARVGGNEKETTAFLVNIQIAPWGAPKEWVEGFVDGFNRAAKWMQSALTEFHSAPVEEPATNALNALKRARDGWQEEAASLVRRLKNVEADTDLLRKHQSKDVWYFQGDGEDHIESMGDNMVVVIHAHDLRTLIAAAPAQSEVPNKAFVVTLMSAAAKSGDEGAVKLAAQLAGVAPCGQCGFVNYHCRCTSNAAPSLLAMPVTWRELCRRLYVELFHCDQQMRSTRDEDGEPHWTQSAVVRDVLADAKMALQAAPQTAQTAQTFEQWASDPQRADKIPLAKHPNGAYSDSRSYLIYYGWKSALKHGVAQSEQTERVLTEPEITEGWHKTFSTENPYCPCNLKSFTKAVRWAERALTAAQPASAAERGAAC